MKYTTVISAEDLNQHISNDNWVVVDCRFTLTKPDVGQQLYEAAHIPGATYLHLNDDLSAPITKNTGRHPLPEPAVLTKKLGEIGIDNDTQVIVYDDAFGSMASRLWWLLRWMGHDAVALLDGGLPAWTRKGFLMTSDIKKISTKIFEPSLRPDMVVDTSTMESIVSRKDHVIIDARAEERFDGDIEPLDKVAGHIPGALNSPFDDNLDIDGTFMPKDEMTELYANFVSDKPASQVILMCGSGVTACHNLVAMEIAGFTGARLYAGSWSEWIVNNSHPISVGK